MDANQQLQSFLNGTNFEAQNYFGAHECENGFVFRTWAPKASRVMLTGDFNNWNDDVALKKVGDSGVWEIKLPFGKITEGTRYKYRIYGCGQVHYKADPYSVFQEADPDNSSLLTLQSEYAWKDGGWLGYRKKYQKDIESKPLNIYEVHLSTWKRKNSRGEYLNYRDCAREIAPYVKQMGYTHICLMPIAEYSNDASMGCAPTSFFAPTSRFGSPEDFKALVDKMHEAGIGVMLGWHISEFPKERHSLFEFDGGELYERELVENEQSTKYSFAVDKKEVQSFLISSAEYWLREYHIDSLCISNVDELLNSFMGDEEQTFLKRMISVLKKDFPDVIVALRGTREDPKKFGADISFNPDWADKMLEYASLEYNKRHDFHDRIVEDINAPASGRTVFPVSYRNMCYGKRSCIDKMFGDYWQKFAGGRAMVGLMMTMHGKKLLFMGSEFAQFDEWGYDRETEWFLLEYESHAKFQRYVAELNNFYISHSALWQRDKTDEGFAWIDRDNRDESIIIFRRSSKTEELVVVANLTPEVHEGFSVGSHSEGTYEELFNSDDIRFYGSGVINSSIIKTVREPSHGYKHSFKLRVPPLGISILSFKGKAKRQAKQQ